MTPAQKRRLEIREKRTAKFKERLANRKARPDPTDKRALQSKRRKERNPKEVKETKTIGRDASKRKGINKGNLAKIADVLPRKEGSFADSIIQGSALVAKYGKDWMKKSEEQKKTDGQPTEKKPGQVQDTQKQPGESTVKVKDRRSTASQQRKDLKKVSSDADTLKLTPDSKNWRRSDALTKLPGSDKVRGVMTRSQAKAFDLKNQKALQKLKPNSFRQWGGWKGWG